MWRSAKRWKHRLESNYSSTSIGKISMAWIRCCRNRKSDSSIWTPIRIHHCCSHAIWGDIHLLNISPNAVPIFCASTFWVIHLCRARICCLPTNGQRFHRDIIPIFNRIIHRSKCTGSGNIFGRSKNLRFSSRPVFVRELQPKQHLFAAMCGRHHREHWLCQIFHEIRTRRNHGKVRMPKLLHSRCVPTEIGHAAKAQANHWIIASHARSTFHTLNDDASNSRRHGKLFPDTSSSKCFALTSNKPDSPPHLCFTESMVADIWLFVAVVVVVSSVDRCTNNEKRACGHLCCSYFFVILCSFLN